MKNQSILILTLSCIGLLGVGSYFLMSDYKQKQAFNIDVYGNPQGDKGIEMSYQRKKFDQNDYGSTFGGKRTKHNRKSNLRSKRQSKRKQ
jgi:hypothetical protein